MSGHNTAVLDPDAPEVYPQFEDIDQQQESYIVGMWTFLVTEVMFFGAMFVTFALYIWKHNEQFSLASNDLNWQIGGINTFILLVSSFLVASAVHFAQLRKTKMQLLCLTGTVLCALAFVVLKLVLEWKPKFEHGLFPNAAFVQNYAHYEHAHATDPNVARLFYSMYFTMTGLHAVHVVIGVLVFLWLMHLIRSKHQCITDHIYTEMVALYWHFVDLVWIFLYPLFYLMPDAH